MHGDNKRLDRRSVLKTIGAAAVVGTGLTTTTGTVVAESDRLARNYRNERRLRVAFEQHGAGLRQQLVDAGFVSEEFDFGDVNFDIDPDVTGLEPTAEDRLAGVTGTVEKETVTALGMASTSSDTHEIGLYVQPERDEAYALVEPKDGDRRFIVTDSEVTPQGCSYTGCVEECCAENYKKQNTYNCDQNCRNCYVYSTDCACSDDVC
ncbi:hypothetical protein [Halorussus aquaticus]|uniref:Twin-arginine translocation signal domain-containing protein n=1 Tax=Halorussus aquaticus TaxID=2953748 RepID=A0ABD5PY78_9EURY|nr:hypothetical protein [Halorussus aquaticus]